MDDKMNYPLSTSWHALSHCSKIKYYQVWEDKNNPKHFEKRDCTITKQFC